MQPWFLKPFATSSLLQSVKGSMIICGDIHVQIHGLAGNFPTGTIANCKVQLMKSVDYVPMAEILVQIASSPDEFACWTAITWVRLLFEKAT
ncbi:hypothetical protein L2E82_12361 [Cichorium intybus]|uniref:Uncharacterized protein n=1 Tax=Cichorium intybus TaxID=13427 RepID=A0ACB9GFB5_CICIN|nr:hypothetical protein L2E82_12361 [Cichorium intybus]